jgi:hypothetical protein
LFAVHKLVRRHRLMNRLWIANNRNELVLFITEAQPIFDEVKVVRSIDESNIIKIRVE